MHEGHSHAHDHSHAADKSRAMLTYMLEHNRHHAEEIHEIAHKLEHGGQDGAAALLHQAVMDFESGNAKLEAALAALKGD